MMTAQMRQMGHVGNELAMQRLAQQYQAILAQVLFETEQATRQIRALGAQDRFAAGIHARLKLNALQEIHPGLFDRYETKRAWAGATEQLNTVWSAVDSDPQWSNFGRNVVRAVETLRQWQAFVGDPQASLAAVTANAQKARKSAKATLWWALGLFASGPVLFIVAAIAKAPALATLMVFAWLAAILVLFSWFSRNGRAKRAADELASFQQQLASFNAFLADPLGGQLLDQAAATHPALTA
jgi:hypothetical protein